MPAKHTPGPWIRQNWDDCGGYECIYAGIEVGPVTLDGVNYGQNPFEDTFADADRMHADACLIEAAPDLLAALRALLDHEGERVRGCIGIEFDSPELEAAKKAAEAALIKAEGLNDA